MVGGSGQGQGSRSLELAGVLTCYGCWAMDGLGPRGGI